MNTPASYAQTHQADPHIYDSPQAEVEVLTSYPVEKDVETLVVANLQKTGIPQDEKLSKNIESQLKNAAMEMKRIAKIEDLKEQLHAIKTLARQISRQILDWQLVNDDNKDRFMVDMTAYGPVMYIKGGTGEPSSNNQANRRVYPAQIMKSMMTEMLYRSAPDSMARLASIVLTENMGRSYTLSRLKEAIAERFNMELEDVKMDIKTIQKIAKGGEGVYELRGDSTYIYLVPTAKWLVQQDDEYEAQHVHSPDRQRADRLQAEVDALRAQFTEIMGANDNRDVV